MVQPLIGPKRKPQEFGMEPNDYHLVVNDHAETCKAFRGDGRFLWEVPALARGQGPDTKWWEWGSDTPPGLYQVGQVYRDYERPNQNDLRTLKAYGWYSLDLLDLEGQERQNGRAGIMIHGGGSALGWPGAWGRFQRLLPTLGCIRMHNEDLREKVIPMVDEGAAIFVSVYQELA